MNVNMIMQFGEFFTPYAKCTTDSYNSKNSFLIYVLVLGTPKLAIYMYIVETRGLDYKK